jgi:N-methylhydantoinase A/oxoprolinase/acetone carboxylase beta subunit
LSGFHNKCIFDLFIDSAEKSSQFPVLTFSSGPTNSMRGAAHLSQNQDAIVVDIGGTTTDVGVLVAGFPRPASTRVKCGGVTTNFRMPDVFSIALGGGSIVSNEGVKVYLHKN